MKLIWVIEYSLHWISPVWSGCVRSLVASPSLSNHKIESLHNKISVPGFICFVSFVRCWNFTPVLALVPQGQSEITYVIRLSNWRLPATFEVRTSGFLWVVTHVECGYVYTYNVLFTPRREVATRTKVVLCRFWQRRQRLTAKEFTSLEIVRGHSFALQSWNLFPLLSEFLGRKSSGWRQVGEGGTIYD